jgi:GAF domain-containing protein
VGSPLSSALPALEALARETTVPSLLRATCKELVELLDASACVLSRVIGELLVTLVDCSRVGADFDGGHGYLIPDYPLTQEVVERGESRFLSLLDPSPDPAEAALLRRLGFESMLMLPLPSMGRCWGLVEIYANDGRRFSKDDANLAEQVVVHAGRLLEQLEHQAARTG